MSAEHDSLREALDRINAQLEEIRKLHPARAAQLDAALSDAKAVVAGQEASSQRSLKERLEDAVRDWEASHPHLATQLEGLIDALAQIGI